MTKRALSPSIAYGCIELIGAVSRNDLTPVDATSLTLASVRSGDVLATALSIRWIELSDSGLLTLTLCGSRVLEAADIRVALRFLILDYIDAENPSWVQLATYGRREVLSQAPTDLAQVFVEAGLGYGVGDDVVSFWDALAARARGIRGVSLTETGRQGERLTLLFERLRVNDEPKWIALDSNSDGYDVLSRVSASDRRRLTIEVKASVQHGLAGHFYLSQNEWSLALDSRFHTFHLWDISTEQPRLAILDVGHVQEHVPKNIGQGEWQSIRVPFAAFSAQFVVQNLNASPG